MYTPTFPRVTIRLESLNLAHGKPKLLDCQAQSVELDGRITFYLDLTNSKLKQNHFEIGVGCLVYYDNCVFRIAEIDMTPRPNHPMLTVTRIDSDQVA